MREETNPVQIILLLKLFLNLLVNTQAKNKWVTFPGGSARIGVDQAQGFMEMSDRLAGILDLFIHRVLEIAMQALDLLGLLLQVRSQTDQLVDDFAFNLGGLVGFQIALTMEVTDDLIGIGQTPRFEE